MGLFDRFRKKKPRGAPSEPRGKTVEPTTPGQQVAKPSEGIAAEKYGEHLVPRRDAKQGREIFGHDVEEALSKTYQELPNPFYGGGRSLRDAVHVIWNSLLLDGVKLNDPKLAQDLEDLRNAMVHPSLIGRNSRAEIERAAVMSNPLARELILHYYARTAETKFEQDVQAPERKIELNGAAVAHFFSDGYADLLAREIIRRVAAAKGLAGHPAMRRYGSKEIYLGTAKEVIEALQQTLWELKNENELRQLGSEIHEAASKGDFEHLLSRLDRVEHSVEPNSEKPHPIIEEFVNRFAKVVAGKIHIDENALHLHEEHDNLRSEVEAFKERLRELRDTDILSKEMSRTLDDLVRRTAEHMERVNKYRRER